MEYTKVKPEIWEMIKTAYEDIKGHKLHESVKWSRNTQDWIELSNVQLPYSYIDFGVTDSTRLSAIPSNASVTLTSQCQVPEKTRAKKGIFIKYGKLFRLLDSTLLPHELSQMAEKLDILVRTKKADSRPTEVKVSSVRHVYGLCAKQGVCGSCMIGMPCEVYDIYDMASVRCLYVTDAQGTVRARALLWDVTEAGTYCNYKVVDTIYHDSYPARQAIVAYALSRGYYVVGRNCTSFYSGVETIDLTGFVRVSGDLDADISLLPYINSFDLVWESEDDEFLLSNALPNGLKTTVFDEREYVCTTSLNMTDGTDDTGYYVSAGVLVCASCGVAIDGVASIYVDDIEDYLCQDCYNDAYGTCDYCEEVYHDDNLVLIDTAQGTICLCEGCAESHAVCRDCGNLYERGDVYDVEGDGEEYICWECYKAKYQDKVKHRLSPAEDDIYFDLVPVYALLNRQEILDTLSWRELLRARGIACYDLVPRHMVNFGHYYRVLLPNGHKMYFRREQDAADIYNNLIG